MAVHVPFLFRSLVICQGLAVGRRGRYLKSEVGAQARASSQEFRT
jgi:hypothetical protein